MERTKAEEEMSELKFEAFPYKPYSIQLQFMSAIYRSLDRGGISMLESPTGTGKTLSIICSTLQWVTDRRRKEAVSKSQPVGESVGTGDCGDDEPDWMRDFVVNKDVDRLSDRHIGNNRSKNIKSEFFSSIDLDKEEFGSSIKSGDDNEESEFLLEEYESEEEGACGGGGGGGGGTSKRKACAQASCSSSSDEEEEDSGRGQEIEKDFKVYFCSRTHSQLSQFVKELRKTTFDREIKVVCLASRKNFCINEEVLKLGNSTRINELCLELQNNKKTEVYKIKSLSAEGKVLRTKASSGCPMLRKQKLQKLFKDEVSQAALDIEDLLHLGRKIGTCPYYGTRSMIPTADLVVLPYQSLLSKSSRESLGLNLKNSVIVIDEAHNLADTVISMYDAKISFSQLENVHCLVEKYFARFRSRLGPGNRRYVQTLIVLTLAFQKILVNNNNLNCSATETEKASDAKSVLDISMAINDFLFMLNIDNINLVKLRRYIKESNIIHKVSGYGEKIAGLQTNAAFSAGAEYDAEGSTLSSFQAVVDFLVSLTNKDGDGRVIISRTNSACSVRQGGFLKYVMLTGEKIFSEIVDEAHAVIMAGGTLQPVEETRERLFPWLPPNELHFFSCNHIVPAESILPIAVSRGPTGRYFDFSYSSRSSSAMIEELGLLVCNLAAVVPEGIVVFFSSFEYEGLVYDTWKASGIVERIVKKKHLFREPKKSSDVELVLKEYKETIGKLSNCVKQDTAIQSGAMMLAVVGGKVSEGINFSDGMGRCIVMVGLPYPSPSDIELMERIKYIESLGQVTSAKTAQISTRDECYSGDIKAAFSILRSCRRRGKEYYENLCMKAVNQSIGRAIRHINDYAAILLVDMRYGSDSSNNFSNPTKKLPHWIRDRLVSMTKNYGEVHRLLHQFFKFKRLGENK